VPGNNIIFYDLRAHPLEYFPALKAADELGLGVVLITRRSPELFAHLSPWIAHCYRLDTSERGKAEFEQGLTIARRHDVCGVMTWSDGLPAPAVNSAMLTRNKLRGRVLCSARAPEIVPRHSAVSSVEDLRSAIAEIGYGGVLKPASGAGSAGVFTIDDDPSAEKHHEWLARFARASTHPLFLDGDGELLYEAKLGGSEHSVEALVQGGNCRVVAVTDKEIDPQTFIEVAHVQPTRLSSAQVSAAAELTEQVVELFGLDDCAVHLECKVEGNRARLVEVAARIGGGNITSHLVPLTTGDNFYADAIRIACGKEVHAPTSTRDRVHAGVVKIIAERPGRLLRFPGLEELAQRFALEGLAIHRLPGSEISVPPADYAGALLATVILSGPTRSALADMMTEARELLKPEFEYD
jgi:biotin carboxylase